MTLLREFRSRLALAKTPAIEPCLPTAATAPPSASGWIHEIKHDGYRMMVRRDAAGARVLTRNGHDWSGRYALIAAAANAVKAKSFVLDGECVVCDHNGLAVFEKLRSRRHDAIAFLYAFDLLELNGKDLRREPIEKRRHVLAGLIGKTDHPGLRFVESMPGDGAVIFEHACMLGCEGIVSKRLGSRYVSGRSREWIKTKNPNALAVRREKSEDWGKRR